MEQRRMVIRFSGYSIWFNRFQRSQTVKRLKTENFRDRMDDIELILTMLGEATTTRFTRDRDPQEFPELRNDVKDGGDAAGATRKYIEEKLGKSVVSSENYLEVPEKTKRIGNKKKNIELRS